MTFTVDDDTRQTLDKLKEVLGIPRSEIIRRGVQAYVRELGATVIPQLKQVEAKEQRRAAAMEVARKVKREK